VEGPQTARDATGEVRAYINANVVSITLQAAMLRKKRQIPWENVDCLSWIKLTTVHDEQNGISHVIWSEFELMTCI